MVVEIALSSNENSGIDIRSNWTLPELKYVSNLVLPNDDPPSLQVFLNLLNVSVATFDIRFTYSV